MKHKSEIPKNPGDLNPQIPEDLSGVILKCLEKDKEKRYQSAGELRSDVSKIEDGIPTAEKIVSKRKPFTLKEITVTFGLKKIFIPALVFISLAIIGVILWKLLPSKKAVPMPSGKPSLAVLYFENNTGEEGLDHWRKAIAELLTTGRLHDGDINAKSYYMLGKIWEQKGEKSKAHEFYQKFLDLWKDADPGQPEVEDAKKRLAALQG